MSLLKVEVLQHWFPWSNNDNTSVVIVVVVEKRRVNKISCTRTEKDNMIGWFQ